ncbi:MAG TPA: thiamine biosynthesis protein ThiC, partial [Planctomycetes bacterium]|nr:thiamine biosynthesis protein ThiC [Planctomycetota bacterium]
MPTQLQSALEGKITAEVEYVANRENLEPGFIKDELAAGRLVIPANRVHLASNLKPVAIGRAVTTKINANIGASNVRSSLEGEIEKLQTALDAGADAVMDLSTGGDLDHIREELLARCPAPFGTVPIYEVIIDRNVEDIDHDTILKVIRKQAKQGVDFFTIHAGVTQKTVSCMQKAKRIMGIVSRGGAILAEWLIKNSSENP